jgi:hypothetical protein
MAEQQGVDMVVQSKDASGISKAYDFLATQMVLHETANGLKKALEWCVDTFGRYILTKFNAEISIPDNYDPLYTERKLTRALNVWKDTQPMPGTAFHDALLYQIAEGVFAGDDDILEKIESEVSTQTIDKQYAEPTQPTEPIEGDIVNE